MSKYLFLFLACFVLIPSLAYAIPGSPSFKLTLPKNYIYPCTKPEKSQTSSNASSTTDCNKGLPKKISGVKVNLKLVEPSNPYELSFTGNVEIKVPSNYKGRAIIFYGDATSEIIPRVSKGAFKMNLSHSYNTDNKEADYNVIIVMSSVSDVDSDINVMKDPYYSKNTVIARRHVIIKSLIPIKYSATIDRTGFSIDSPKLSGTASSNLKSITVEISDSAGTKLYQADSIPVKAQSWTTQITKALKNGTYTIKILSNGTLIAKDTLLINKPIVNSETSFSKVGLGKYESFSGEAFGITKEISYQDALDNCKLNAANNPTRPYRCLWNGHEIYNQAGTIK